MVVATHVKTTTEAVTKEQSKNMLKNAIRTSISSIAYLRNLFEEEAFDESSVSGLQLKTLKPYNSEAKLILDWLNLGVIDALEKDDLIECYHFKFRYSDSGPDLNVSLRRGSCKAESLNCRTNPCTKDEAKQQLWYYDEKVPVEYEPQLFRPATLDEQLKFNEVPFECSVGRVDTGYHTLSIRVKSTADEDVEYEGMDVDESNKHFATNGEVCEPSQDVLEHTCTTGGIKDPIQRSTNDSKKQSALYEYETKVGDMPKTEGYCDIVDMLRLRCTSINNLLQNFTVDFSQRQMTLNENTVTKEEIHCLLSDAIELAKSTKFIKKETIASGLGVDVIVAKPLVDRLMEKGIISSKLVRGKGYESKVYVPPKSRQNKRCRKNLEDDADGAETQTGMLCYFSEQLTIPTKIYTRNNKTRRSTRRSS